MTTTHAADISDLFTSAADDGNLSVAGLQLVQVDDLGAQIQAGFGIDVDDVDASEVTLVTLLIDDSSSIQMGNNTQLIRDGHNLILKSLKKSVGILMHTRFLNRGILYPFTPIDQVPLLDTSNYNPSGGTPLFDEIQTTLATVVAKVQEFADNGVPVRAVTVVITDGADYGSRRMTGPRLKPLVDDMLASEQHIIAGMGIDDGYTNFHQVFTEMGIHPDWVLTPGNTEAEIRKAFALISQSAVRASQGAGFSQTGAGGFGS